ESMNRWASVRHSHQSNISTVFIESIESAPFDNLTLCNRTVIPDNTAISKFVIPAQAGIRTPDAAGIYRK
ncbi:hypothetical protein, partial [Neisseria gonorrhoeae]|uniref:hypothetical protein n=1 Tax=Neisseria gonorrhoeae TaxID=485 RepID=UPI0027D9B1CC